MADHGLCGAGHRHAHASFSFSACLSPSIRFCESQFLLCPFQSCQFRSCDLGAHVAPRCCQARVGTIFQWKPARVYSSGIYVVYFDQGRVTLFAVTRWHASAHPHSIPNARADTRRSGTGPGIAAPNGIESSGHHPHLPWPLHGWGGLAVVVYFDEALVAAIRIYPNLSLFL